MRRALLGTAAVGLGLLLSAPHAHAQESITSGPYKGSRTTTAPTTASPDPVITAEIERAYNASLYSMHVNTTLAPPAGLPAGCASDVGQTKISPGPRADTSISSARASMSCNGEYRYQITAQLRGVLNTDPGTTLSGSIKVAVPPADVTGVSGRQAEDRSVRIEWARATNPAPDFLGYVVQRQRPDGEWTTLTTADSSTRSFVDTDVPTTDPKIYYRVLARRAGPGHEVLSKGGGRAEVPVFSETPPSTTPPGGDGGATDGGAGDGGAGGEGGAGGAGGAGGNGGANRGGGSGSDDRGDIGGVNAPRLGRDGIDLPGLEVDGDDFDPELPYGALDDLGGDVDGDLPSLAGEGSSGRGMAVPVATGFVLAAWAFHLRFLARAARPV